MLILSIQKTLNELSELLTQIPDDIYTKPCGGISNSTIGQHTRHIIEMFQCLLEQYNEGIINYDSRKRNKQIEISSLFAKNCIDEINNQIDLANKNLTINQVVNNEDLLIESNYFRELLYNLEHCIHHQALIKVVIIDNNLNVVNENFGVAPSTIEYRKQCAQ